MTRIQFMADLVAGGDIPLSGDEQVQGLVFRVDELAAIRAAMRHGVGRRMVVVLHIEEPGEQLDLPLLGASGDLPPTAVRPPFPSDGTECTARRPA